MIVLEKLKVKGNIIIGILVFSIIAWVADLSKFNGVVGSIPPMTHLLTFDLKSRTNSWNGNSCVYIIFCRLF